MHGKTSIINIDNDNCLFKNLPENIKVGRYHSLTADTVSIPSCLKITARTDDGTIMAVKHKDYNIFGLQFHPESILTPEGKNIIENFLKEVK